VVLRAERATFLPDTDVAKLEVVRAVVTNESKGRSFEMTCDRADLNVETHDFLAEGNVAGVTGDGQRYSAPWVRYEHARDLLSTDAPVVMVDDAGSFRGNGFRYHVKERRFKLLGNVTVVQGR
jgi:LPS export ABC transporter protein LptC